MNGPVGVRSAGRRFVVLTVLRWLPVGISVPVTVLLAAARGLTPADIGLVVAVYSIVTLTLELPTGGLADAIGHRPVLVLSGVVTVAGILTVAAADSVALFALGWGLKGVGRSLDSGPLEAWYVDTVRAADPTADVTPGLSRGAAADGGGLALGAVLGGLLPLLADEGGSRALALPLLLAAALGVVSVVGVLLLVTPVGSRRGTGPGALRAGLREVPAVIRDTSRLVTRDGVLRNLLAVSLLTGVALTTLELIGPLHFADLAGSATGGSAVFGAVMAVSFAAAGVGSLLAPAARRAARGSVAVATAALAVLGAATVVAAALAPGAAVAGVAFAAYYLVNAAGWPLRQQLLHGRVTSAQRTTTLSASSLAVRAGGLAGSLLVPRLAEASGNPVGLGAAAVATLLIAVVSLRLPSPSTAGRVEAAEEVPAVP